VLITFRQVDELHDQVAALAALATRLHAGREVRQFEALSAYCRAQASAETSTFPLVANQNVR
jgi:hypothetical protein